MRTSYTTGPASQGDDRDKSRNRRRGYLMTDEHKQAISEGLKGRKLSDEHRRKLSEAHSGKVFTEEHKRNMSEAKKGRTFTAEHKANLSKGIKKALDEGGSRKRRKCVFKGVSYRSIGEAARQNNVTTTNVIYYIKSDKHADSYYDD